MAEGVWAFLVDGCVEFMAFTIPGKDEHDSIASRVIRAFFLRL
jgi:hypothetical protein